MKLGKEKIKESVESLGYHFLGEYIKNKKRKVIVEDGFGYKYDVEFRHLIDNTRNVSFVHIRNPFTLENISLWLKLNNKNFKLCDGNIYKGTCEKLLFFCLFCNEIFDMSWHSINSMSCGCPFCAGVCVGKYNNLKYLRPDLATEWNYEYNDDFPENYTYGSEVKKYWTCSNCSYGKNGEWFSQIKSRVAGHGCPACDGKVVTDRNRLSILFPEIAKEWDYEKNSDTPDDAPYEKNEKRWWVCRDGHSYFSSINSRTNVGAGCKKCSDKRQESFIASGLKQYFLKNYWSEDEYPIFKNPETGYPLPYDLYLFGGENPEINGTYVEINWKHHYEITTWHRLAALKNGTTPKEEFAYQKKKDRMKREFARKNGIYIEIDLRKTKTVEDAIEYIKKSLI